MIDEPPSSDDFSGIRTGRPSFFLSARRQESGAVAIIALYWVLYLLILAGVMLASQGPEPGSASGLFLIASFLFIAACAVLAWLLPRIGGTMLLVFGVLFGGCFGLLMTGLSGGVRGVGAAVGGLIGGWLVAGWGPILSGALFLDAGIRRSHGGSTLDS